MTISVSPSSHAVQKAATVSGTFAAGADSPPFAALLSETLVAARETEQGDVLSRSLPDTGDADQSGADTAQDVVALSVIPDSMFWHHSPATDLAQAPLPLDARNTGTVVDDDNTGHTEHAVMESLLSRPGCTVAESGTGQFKDKRATDLTEPGPGAFDADMPGMEPGLRSVKADPLFTQSTARPGEAPSADAQWAASPSDRAVQELSQSASVRGQPTPAVTITSAATPLNLQPATMATAIESRIGSPGWNGELHDKVALLVHTRTQVAELQMTPPDMGSIEIRIDFSDDQPQVVISAQQTDTRNALDAALPRLRELLADSGITLGGTSVGHRQEQQSSFIPDRSQTITSHSRFALTDSDSPRPHLSPDQLVDTYA